MFILIEKEGILEKKQASSFQTQRTYLSEQDRKYYQHMDNEFELSENLTTKFIDSVYKYMMDFWRFNDKTELLKNIDKIDSSYYVGLSPKGYYDYLETKIYKHYVENQILRNKSRDKKFAKQLDNIDPSYFYDSWFRNPKDLIFVYFFFENSDRLSTVVFYDIQTVSRIFRKFDDSKGRFKSCDEENKSLRNIIIYSGNTHTQNINEFLLKLPRLRLLSEPISGIELKNPLMKETYLQKIELKQNYQSLSGIKNLNFFGDFRLFTKSELEFPTNIDYFGYNEKIINELKQEYNVRNYLQIEKKLIQQQEEQKMKQI